MNTETQIEQYYNTYYLYFLQIVDEQFLSLFQRFLTEVDRFKKLRLYEQLATWVLAPVGAVWKEGDRVMNLDAQSITSELEQEAFSFWHELVGI